MTYMHPHLAHLHPCCFADEQQLTTTMRTGIATGLTAAEKTAAGV